MTELLRRLALFNQGLSTPHHFGEGLSGTCRAIEHLGYVQIDTLAVVERAHHHVLWSRVPNYSTDHLNTLIQQKHIFEYWYHAASYLPMQDYRYALPQMASIRSGENRYYSNGDKRLMKEIMVRVQAEGEIRLRDIDKANKSNTGTWWSSGPGRRSIEQLFMQGDLMICERNGMEKIYDLAENCLPQNIDLSVPTLSEYALYLFNTTLRAHGVFTWKQLLHLKVGKTLRDVMRQIVNEQLEAGVIKAVNNSNGQVLYVDQSALNHSPVIEPKVKILSPFDNLVIHRDRLNGLFKFDYRIECYVPAAKRLYGYFCLPILYGDQLVGRIDCKAHRAKRKFEVLSLHLEDRTIDLDHFRRLLHAELQRFADFNQCPITDESDLLYNQSTYMASRLI